jgi:hypothetical protein
MLTHADVCAQLAALLPPLERMLTHADVCVQLAALLPQVEHLARLRVQDAEVEALRRELAAGDPQSVGELFGGVRRQLAEAEALRLELVEVC